MRQISTIILSIITGTVLFIAGSVAFVEYFDWNTARPFIDEKITHALGRPFLIAGNLAISWAREDVAPDWHGWVPWPHFVAEDVSIGNPAAMAKTNADNHLVTVKKVMFSISPMALLDQNVVIPALVLESPDVSLVRGSSGVNNWSFDFGSKPSVWKVKLNRLVINHGSMQLDDALHKLQLKGTVETVSDDNKEGYGINWVVGGQYNGAAVDGHGRAGALLNMQNEAMPYPLSADIRVGKTHIDLKGTLTKPDNLAALDLRLALKGNSMADLYPLTGITLPETPPFDTEGHLIGSMSKRGDDFRYEQFKGRVGSSDLSGSFEYQSPNKPARPRPLLTGKVVSNLLLFSDLAPIVGANKKEKGAAVVNNAPTQAKVSDKVLPTEQFKLERWQAIDVDVQFSGRKIVRDVKLPLDNLNTHIKLQDGTLSLLPLEFGVAGGTLTSNIVLNGNGTVINAKLSTAARHIQLRQLAPNFQPMQSSLGEINGNAALSGSGNSVAALLGTSNGTLDVSSGQGTISKLLLDEAGLNVLNVLLTKLFGDKQVNLNCALADFTVKNGVMQSRNVVIDTAESTIGIDGQIDLRNEQLALTIKPENKKLRLVSLRAPIYLSGSFKDPNVGIDKGVLALRAGGAIALGILSPVAAILPLVDVGPDNGTACNKIAKDSAHGKTAATTH